MRATFAIALVAACGSPAMVAVDGGALDAARSDLAIPVDQMPPSSGIGAPCVKGSCAAPQRCLEDGWARTVVGGYCTADCDATHACPLDATCVRFAGDIEVCARRCTSSAGCREPDYACDPFVGACEGEPRGSVDNRVLLQRFYSDGLKDSVPVRVSAPGESVVFDDPSIALDGPRVYVGYVVGDFHGHWDVRAASSLDGGRSFDPPVTVNDDAPCATHYRHQLAVDGRGHVHALYLDERRWPLGGVWLASSPPAGTGAALAFGASRRVDDAEWRFTGRRDRSAWLGDYIGLDADGNTLHAVWADPRATLDGNDVSHVYYARGPAP